MILSHIINQAMAEGDFSDYLKKSKRIFQFSNLKMSKCQTYKQLQAYFNINNFFGKF